MDRLHENTYTLMRNNQRRHGDRVYTVPAAERYPFQWFWDSCFHALIYSALGDTDTAKAELSTLVGEPLPSGLLPHILFHQPAAERPVWGRELESPLLDAAWGTATTSSLIQPPLIARAVLETYLTAPDDAWLASILPALTQHYTALRTERRLTESELLAIINPDESGEDNASRFDTVLAIPHPEDDTAHLAARTALIRTYATHQQSAKAMLPHCAVIDLSFNCIYKDGLDALAELYQISGDTSRAHATMERAAATAAALSTLHRHGTWHNHDLTHNQLIPLADWTQFMPLFAGVVDHHKVKHYQRQLLDSATFAGAYGLRTESAQNTTYSPTDGFWRGPVWAAPHWFIARGFNRYGYQNTARQLRAQLVTLITRSGFREYYHPDTGIGLGATGFTWSGLALTLDATVLPRTPRLAP